jgi:phospholipid/cholesterol/gamma-HCH transport system substrate-binding protein
MERNAHYAAIGLATSILVVGLLLFVIWLARFKLAQDYDVYEVHFHGAVRGLSTGGEVHFNGIKVGEVTKLQLGEKDTNLVVATVRLTSNVPVKTDTHATLEPQGITGVSYIQLSAGSQGAPLLKRVTPPDRVPVIEGLRGPLSELFEGGSTVLLKAVDALNRVNRVLSDENIRSFSGSLHNVHDITAEMREHKAIIAKAEVAVENAGEAAKQLAELSKSGRSLVDGDGAKAVRTLEQSAADVGSAAKQMDRLMAKVQGPTSDFAQTGLPQMTSTAASLQQTADSLNQLAREAQRSPQGLLAKSPSKEVRVRK